MKTNTDDMLSRSLSILQAAISDGLLVDPSTRSLVYAWHRFRDACNKEVRSVETPEMDVATRLLMAQNGLAQINPEFLPNNESADAFKELCAEVSQAVTDEASSARQIGTTSQNRGSSSQNDLSRKFLIDVSANGACFVRARSELPAYGGLLPMFSTDDRESAEALLVRFCTLARDGSGIYWLNRSLFDPNTDGPKRIGQLFCVVGTFREEYRRMLAKRTGGS